MIWSLRHSRNQKRGNPQWGKPLQPLPALPTAFAAEVARLGLERSEYSASPELKRWCTAIAIVCTFRNGYLTSGKCRSKSAIAWCDDLEAGNRESKLARQMLLQRDREPS